MKDKRFYLLLTLLFSLLVKQSICASRQKVSKALSKRNKGISKPSSKYKHDFSEEYDEEDQYDEEYDESEDEEFESVRPTRRKKSQSYGKGALVPIRKPSTGRKSYKPQNSIFSTLATTMLSKASEVQSTSKGKALELRKLVKGKVSSQFERFMLQLTWPDDSPLDATFTSDMMHYLDTADDYPDEMSPTNPFRRTLRKVCARMNERDHRTVIKSIMLVHHMATDLGTDSLTRVRKHILTMRKEVNSKKKNETYFQLARIVDVNPNGKDYVPFIKVYASYAFKRLTAFPSGFKSSAQSKVKSKKTTKSEITALVNLLDSLIIQGTAVKLGRKEHLTDLTKSTLRLMCSDLLVVWKVYVSGVERLLSGQHTGKSLSAKEKKILIKRYNTVKKELSNCLQWNKKIKIVKDASKFEDNQVDKSLLAEAASMNESENRKIDKAAKTEKKSKKTVVEEKSEEESEDSQESSEEVSEKDEAVNEKNEESDEDSEEASSESEVEKSKKEEEDDSSDENSEDEGEEDDSEDSYDSSDESE